MEKFEGYKTVVFSVLALLIGIANLLGFGSFELSTEWQEALLVILPLITFLLRVFTKKPIFNG